MAFNLNEDHNRGLLRDMHHRLNKIYAGGGEKAVAKHKGRGKMTARERIHALVDDRDSFVEVGAFAAEGMYTEYGGCPSAGVVTGIGKVSGRLCVIIANDATVKAGA